MTTVVVDRFRADRWLQPDARIEISLKMDLRSGEVMTTRAEDWMKLWTRASVDPPVPPDIISLFEQARGAICYGYFFYPLYALGVEQLSRVAEAAMATKCESLGSPKSVNTFAKRIDWLADGRRLPGFDREHWHLTREFRNEASHPRWAKVLSPAAAAPMLGGLARDIQALFASTADTS